MPRTLVTLVLAFALAAPAAARGAPANSAWLSYGHDAQLTNAVPAGGLTVKAAKRLRQVWETKLDGTIYASPLYAPGVVVAGRPQDVVYAATEGGSVYALAARSGRVLWHHSLGTVAAGTPEGPCGTWGITGTPSIDVRRGLLYAIGGTGELHALGLADGKPAFGWPVQLTAKPAFEHVWGGLRIAGGRIYVPFASYCDQADDPSHTADGRIVAVNLVTRAVDYVFDPVPGPANLGGDWGWSGVSISPSGTLFAAFGNSFAFDVACGCVTDNAGFANSVVRLSPQLEVLGSNRPPDVPSMGDLDFGASPLLFRPAGCPPLAAANSKNGNLYVWNRLALDAGPLWQGGLGSFTGPFVGQPSWSAQLRMIFDAGTRVIRNGPHLGEGVTAFRIMAHCRFVEAWETVTGVATQPPPIVIGNVLFAVGGNASSFTVISAAKGRVLRRLGADGATDAPPITARGWIYAGDSAGVLHAFRDPRTSGR